MVRGGGGADADEEDDEDRDDIVDVCPSVERIDLLLPNLIPRYGGLV